MNFQTYTDSITDLHDAQMQLIDKDFKIQHMKLYRKVFFDPDALGIGRNQNAVRG